MTPSTILDFPVQRGLAYGRMGLILLAATAILVDPPHDALALRVSWGIIIGYSVIAGLLINIRGLSPVIEHSFDIAASSALIYFTDRSTSPFFAFFVFIQVAAALRWDWRGSIATAAVLAATTLLFWTAGLMARRAGEPEIDQSLVRAGVLLVSGGMFAYLAAYRERAKRRFAELARWAGSDAAKNDAEILTASLRHVADVIRSDRILVIWEEPEEAHRHICLWSQGEVDIKRQPPDAFGEVVTPASDDTVLAGNHPGAVAKLDESLRAEFSIRTALVSRFKRPLCEGWVLFLDRAIEDDEDVSLAEIIASRVGRDLEDGILHRRIARDILMQERMRLGRDLHDGVLQGLAAASIQTGAALQEAPRELHKRLSDIRMILQQEAERVREFVERARTVPIPQSGRTNVAVEIGQRIAILETQWNCAIELKTEPPELTTTERNVEHLRDMLGEAVSNAVRHGQAKHVTVKIIGKGDRLSLHVVDDGQGFANLAGAYGIDVKSGQRAAVGPLSLRSRAEELGGQMYLATDDRGTDLTIELPA